MSNVKIYGIKNCDTMKKAFKWLEQNNVTNEFHDYKKEAPDKEILQAAIKQHGWENVINRRGTTWRKLSEDVQNSMNDAVAIDVACDNPSIIKRPLLVVNNDIHLGFKEDHYKDVFS